MNFFLLKCGKIIYAQVTYAEIAFIYKFFRNLYFRKNRAENAFLDHPVQKTFSGKSFSDWAWINGFGKCCPETIFPEKSAVFPEILFPKMVTRKLSKIILKFWHF